MQQARLRSSTSLRCVVLSRSPPTSGRCPDGTRQDQLEASERACALDFARSLRGPQTGAFSEDMIPTVGFNMRKVTKGNVSIKARFHLHMLRFRIHSSASFATRHCLKPVAGRRLPSADSLLPSPSSGTLEARLASAPCGSDTAEE